MNTLTNYVKKTSNELVDTDELTSIIEYINNILPNVDNLHLFLKLLSNLIINYPNCIKFNIDAIIDTYNNILDDGHIICLIKMYSTSTYNNPYKAIKLTNIYNVHKTSSYVPIFQYLIIINNIDLIIKLFLQLIEQNN